MRVFAQSIVETVRHPLLLLDGLLRVQSANAAFYRTFCIGKAETEGRLLYDLDGGEWDISPLRVLLEGIMPGGSFEDFEVRLDFPRLGRRVMLLNARRVLRDEDGTAMILLAIEDVTEKVQAWDALYKLNRELEDRVRKRTAELETANKELEAFCYSVSHDLRAPLRALDGFSEELLRGYAERLDEKGRHYLQRVRTGTQRMGQLIDDLLQLSRLSRGEMKREWVDLTGLAQAVAAELRQREPSRRVSFDIQSDLTGQGDPGLLKVVLENLLGNAWKFTEKKSSATIAFGKAEHQGRPAYFVRDDGAGFDMSHADKLFGAFQRLHPQRDFPGNGIGLATVQRIIHRHGGQVWAESPPGKGATFYFTLPMKEPS
jgi:light-regulated signal transduction histidine kinase (bacteriophytochrome)